MYYPPLLDGPLAGLAVVSHKEKCPQPSVPFPQCFEINFSVLHFCILWVSTLLLLLPHIKIQQMRHTG